VDRYVGEDEQAHLISVFGNDSDVGAITAAVHEKATFTLTFPDGEVKEVSLGEHASCYKGAVSLQDRKHPVRHLVAVSEALYTNGGVGRTILLGYPGFAYLRGSVRLNPVELLMEALDSDDLDSRVTEALAWLPLAYPHLNWDWLTANAKLRDRQNRLGFVVELARQAAARGGSTQLEEELANHVARLESSRLVKEDTLCRESMTRSERTWLREHRPKSAEHWNLLTDLTVEQLDHVVL
jgi:hypothetical protein